MNLLLEHKKYLFETKESITQHAMSKSSKIVGQTKLVWDTVTSPCITLSELGEIKIYNSIITI